MSGNFFLDWATLAVSLFNAILLLWLCLVVLLNAEPLTWGIWLSSAGLSAGAVFFFIHSVILGMGFASVYWPSDFWWQSGWIPVILAPFAWYVVMLWYTGFWEGSQNPVFRRHRFSFGLLSLAAVFMLGMFIFANPLPSFGQMAHLRLGGSLSFFEFPLIILLYPPFIIACIGSSLDALLKPGPTIRMMGQLARQRARPWLVAASSLLMIVSLLVAGFIAWLVLKGKESTPTLELAFAVGWLDLAISILIAASTVLTGQAVVSYEVFTGKALPRRGLSRIWKWSAILAAGYSVLLAWVVIGRIPLIYSVILTTILLVFLLALFSRKSYRDRQSFISALRPFITSQQLYDHLFQPDADAGTDIHKEDPLQALCVNVLGAGWACLMPAGPLAELFGSPICFPENLQPPEIKPENFLPEVSPETLYHPILLSGDRPGWGIPLRNVRGLCGVLLLGEKQDGGLYSQEEMETARLAGERLMDLKASAEISRRLMILQRRQLAEGQVLDRQVRRALHDDILPRLHAVLLELSNTGPAVQSPDVITTLSETHQQIANLLHDLPAPYVPQLERLGLVGSLQTSIDHELRGAFESVTWQVAPQASQRLPDLPSLQGGVIFFAAREAIRNAARHGRRRSPDLPLELHISIEWKNGLIIGIMDNGSGIKDHNGQDNAAGHGLALHSTLMAVIGGTLEVNSQIGQYTCVTLWLPDWEDQNRTFPIE